MADLGEQYTDKKVEQVSRRINSIYRGAARELREKEDEFWAGHARRDAMYRARVAAGTMSKEDYEAWLRGQVFQGRQWAAKRDAIARTMVRADQAAYDIVNDGKSDVFVFNANYAGYEMEHDLGADIGFGLYNREAVSQLIRDEPDLLPAIDPKKLNSGEDARWYQRVVTNSVTQGIIQGEGIDAIRRRIEQTCADRGRSAAQRDARTAYTGAQNAGRVAAMHQAQDLGLEVKKHWMATLDDKTRDAHRDLDGQEVNIDEPFVTPDGDTIMYPGDPHAAAELVYNCRCALKTVYPKYQRHDVRRDNETGNDVGDMTYREWEEMKRGESTDIPDEFTPVKLIGGKGDAEITDDISDYYLPQATRDRLDEIESMSTYNEFRDYLDKNYGVQLDTGLEALKGARANDSIAAVSEQCQKITTAIDAYRETFGEDALSSLKKVYLYDKDLDVRAAYFFNMVGENDPLAGEIHFSQWGDDGRTIFHELAHAYQDSHKLPGEDAITYSERIIRELGAKDLSAYAGASKEAYAAEQFADAFGFGFSQGDESGLDFMERVAEYEHRRRMHGRR